MNKKPEIPIVVAGALIITGLFHKNAPGLNLLISETILFAWLILTKQFRFIGKNRLIYGIGLLVSLLFTVLTHSVFSYVIHFIVLFIFVGILIYPEAKSLINSTGLSFSNIFNSQNRFLKEFSSLKFRGLRPGNLIWKSRIFIIPLFIITLFVFIYCRSNPVFDKLVVDVLDYVEKGLNYIFKDFDFTIIITFLISLFICNFMLLRNSNQRIIKLDQSSNTELVRIRSSRAGNFTLTALKNEYKAGIFLLLILNVIILVLNSIDIYWVWFNFKWEGQYLKQFVHEGTNLLILSILISIALVLFYFRGNLNFYARNRFLKYLSFIWLAQNGILTISVAIRNLYYIHYFSLAYRRIGVIIFLILTIYGLYTVFVKVLKCKSAFYLFKSNALSLYVVLIISSTINWDSIIAKYNFKHSDTSFLHLDYMATLSDKSLPYLDKTPDELLQIDKIQKEKFPFDYKFMTPETYHEVIEVRKMNFIKKWESKNILSWNWPEFAAYKKLKTKN